MGIFGDSDERIRLAEDNSKESLFWGVITSVDSNKMTMTVEISSSGRPDIATDVPINNAFTNHGMGMRMLPLVNFTYALLYKIDAQKWLHVGYYNEGLEQYLSNKTLTNENATTSILARYLEQGEVELIGLSQNEIFLSNDGSVLLKSQFGASLKLDNMKSRLEGNFANLKLEMDDVRVRAGNVIRPMGYNTETETYNYDDVQFVMNSAGNIISEEDIPEGDESYYQIKEFLIQVGATIDSTTGIDTEDSPYVGMIGMGEKIIDEYGEEIASGGKSLNYLVKTANGGGIAIDEDGSFLVIDQFGGSVTKFTSGGTSGTGGEKSLRIDNNYTSITQDSILINHTSGSTIGIDSSGNIDITFSNGRGITLSETGLSLNFSDTQISVVSDDLQLTGTSTITLGSGAVPPTDTLLTATRFATWFDTIFLPALMLWEDTHTHMSPVGPTLMPSIPFSTILTSLLITPSMLLGVLQAPKIITD